MVMVMTTMTAETKVKRHEDSAGCTRTHENIYGMHA